MKYLKHLIEQNSTFLELCKKFFDSFSVVIIRHSSDHIWICISPNFGLEALKSWILKDNSCKSWSGISFLTLKSW